jgi:malonate-semialdehyde dehydrogenase (acetylating)/methylmalonate-semialdehyde dehydrogenase
MPVLQQGTSQVLRGIDGEVLRALGVFTMIAPFNFPAMVPSVPAHAVAAGNTYVVKPSEQTLNDGSPARLSTTSACPRVCSTRPR